MTLPTLQDSLYVLSDRKNFSPAPLTCSSQGQGNGTEGHSFTSTSPPYPNLGSP